MAVLVFAMLMMGLGDRLGALSGAQAGTLAGTLASNQASNQADPTNNPHSSATELAAVTGSGSDHPALPAASAANVCCFCDEQKTCIFKRPQSDYTLAFRSGDDTSYRPVSIPPPTTPPRT